MFHKFKANDGYEDVSGEFYAAKTEEIVKQEYILTPGRYVGTAEEEDDGIPFAQKMEELTTTLSEQFKESARLEEMIKKNLAGLGYEF
jgi:type I restriction enzyme M protein